jgi:hypothetical protein
LIHSNFPVIAPPTSNTPFAERVGPDTAAGSDGGSGAAALDPDPDPDPDPDVLFDPAGGVCCSLGDFEQAARSESTTREVRIMGNLSLQPGGIRVRVAN